MYSVNAFRVVSPRCTEVEALGVSFSFRSSNDSLKIEEEGKGYS